MASNRGETVEIFCDGSCMGNPGPGGYGTILRYGNQEKELSGYSPDTTNNRMELMAVIKGLEALKRPSRVRVTTDSKYVYMWITTWVHGWQKKDWLNSRKEPVSNRDLWERLLRACEPHSIDWNWIKGHAGHPENERCDRLARRSSSKNLK